MSLLQTRVQMNSMIVFREICDHLKEDHHFSHHEQRVQVPDRRGDDLLGSLQTCVSQLLQNSWTGLNQDWTWVPNSHPMVQMALAVTTPKQQRTHELHIYTDGSAKKGHAAWSFVII